MRVGGKHYRSIFVDDDGSTVVVIDQTKLPFAFELKRLTTMEQAADAITTMLVRGAPLIGVTAAYGVALALRKDPGDASLEHALDTLARTRPTAVNLHWALDRMAAVLRPLPAKDRAARAYAEAAAIADEDVEVCRAIGVHGAKVFSEIARAHAGKPLNVLTHCNAGWLACVDWGTALSAIYAAHDAGTKLHVYVDETRPRNQGASLTAYELGAHGVPHTLIADSAAAHFMQRGQIDVCIVGTDRTTANGDVANKIGTYAKALAARDNGVPFYVALPSSTIDWTLSDGIRQIPIEERAAREVTHLRGRTAAGDVVEVQVAADRTPAANPAFDVTPARLVTGLITERGVAKAERESLVSLFPERRK
ncbi:MAG TPA: S-methyl-5-thioribose-1-phosphate isomerase [Steroidobacteraceae bacterium]|nr:S-methyl-5-thioribose-1-phosphate isomerase [Steroidobacteraceae bacterium]